MVGVGLGLVVVVISAIVLIIADHLVGGDGTAGVAASSTAGNAAAVPTLVAAANPSYAPAAASATVLVAASVIISSLLVPPLTAFWKSRARRNMDSQPIARAHTALIRSGISNPRIGVCAINPHAGENGLFGRGEEASKIKPAVAACNHLGWNVTGPLPADTLFYLAQRGDFDVVIAMYHDQGHGPIKVLGLESGVNITLGLPVIRTSVDHGTAFDIAGTGKADERSMVEAIHQAAQLAERAI